MSLLELGQRPWDNLSIPDLTVKNPLNLANKFRLRRFVICNEPTDSARYQSGEALRFPASLTSPESRTCDTRG